MKGVVITILWLLPIISLFISVAAGLFLTISLKMYRNGKVSVFTKATKTKEFSQ